MVNIKTIKIVIKCNWNTVCSCSVCILGDIYVNKRYLPVKKNEITCKSGQKVLWFHHWRQNWRESTKILVHHSQTQIWLWWTPLCVSTEPTDNAVCIYGENNTILGWIHKTSLFLNVAGVTTHGYMSSDVL